MFDLPGCSSVSTGSLNGVESSLSQMTSKISRHFARQLSEPKRLDLVSDLEKIRLVFLS